MQKSTHQKITPSNIDNLLNDGRLARLFSIDSRHCALQLWVLQIKFEQTIENRIVYGRLLPYNYSSDDWSASDDDNFNPFGQIQAQVIRLNLYVKSAHCADLLRQLSAGHTISEISEALKLGISEKFKARFGEAALAANNLAYRPVAYLLNRDAHDRHSPSSPHGGAGAFSASITQAEKGALFRVGQDYDIALTEWVVNYLNADTGLDFGGADTTRFGDIELLVFPTLNDQKQPLLDVSWADEPLALVARFNPTQVPHFSGFQFCLCITNNGQTIYSGFATAEPDAENVFECRFDLGDQLRAIADSTELEVFGFNDDHSRVGTLCCRWKMYYVREIHFQGNMSGRGASPVKFDWLEKTARSVKPSRVKAALTINRGNLGFANHVGGREADPWVPANRDLTSLFARLHPPKSEGQFFLRWGQSNGEGRLQFVEWFRELLAKHQKCQIVIFDPYFEDIGLGLLLICATEKADFIVFRSLPKRPSKEAEATLGQPDESTPRSGIDNLLANCEHNRQLMKRFRLYIYGLKDGRLHDRYILIMGQDSLPVAGFHLSNSFQKAAENYPLLVTPIPADVLLRVEQYKSELVREAQATQSEGETENPAMRLLFDSTTSPTTPRRYEPLRFLDKTQAGDVLSVWTGEPSLRGLNGDSLRERVMALNLLKDGSLALPEESGMGNCLNQQAGNFTDFTATWEVLGEMLAHSRFGDYPFRELESEPKFLEFLERFLETAFSRPLGEAHQELEVMEARFFQESIDALLHSAYRPYRFFRATKYTALSWPEYYTIKFLWRHSPGVLLAIAETQMASVPIEPQGSDAMRLSLLSQIVSEVSLSMEFGISEVQRELLVHSKNGLLRWIGLTAIEMELEKPGGLAIALRCMADFSGPERVRTLGWMVHRAAGNEKKAEIYRGLVKALHEALPTNISTDELKHLIDSMRGHMRQLAWAEPWLFQDVILPLLQNDRANTDDACKIWVQELNDMLEPDQRGQPQLFDQAREGQTTNITAFLFAYSSPERQEVSLKSVQAILKKQRRIVQPPLASTSNWTRWDGALKVSLWILAFSKWAEYYLGQRGMSDSELGRLSQDALDLVRPMVEWQSVGTGGELAAFLDHVEKLLASSDE